jgi:hypothetical protein
VEAQSSQHSGVAIRRAWSQMRSYTSLHYLSCSMNLLALWWMLWLTLESECLEEIAVLPPRVDSDHLVQEMAMYTPSQVDLAASKQGQQRILVMY